MPETKMKRIGRPPINSTSVNLRLPPDLLAWVDSQRAKKDPEPTRPEFIRQIIEQKIAEKLNLEPEQLGGIVDKSD